MVDYPSVRWDASTFSEEQEDPAVKEGEMDGGYVVSRPRFTRTPRRMFSFKHVDISDADKQTLANFWAARRGSAGAFNWVHPISGVTINVRFSSDMGKMRFNRAGYGTNHRWDSEEIILKEV
jgi:phage-related protein